MVPENAPEGSSSPNGRWQKLVEIHNHAKSVFLCAEEFDPGFQDFLQPILELRHALEHIVRAKAAELGISDGANGADADYILHSLDKAIGHEYRAFFDAADWFSVCIRDRITKTLSRYSHECITAVLTDYYPKFRPRVDQICRNIANIRGDKDIAKGEEVLAEVGEYRAAIDELLYIDDRIQCCVPALTDWRRKNRRASFMKWLLPALGGMLVAAATAWVLIRLGLIAKR